MKYVCKVCGYVYDEALGDPDNGLFEVHNGHFHHLLYLT